MYRLEKPNCSNLLSPFFTGPDSTRKSAFSLGLVNELDGDLIDDEDDPRQGTGDELISSNSKWHKHTVKVFSLLKRTLASGDDEVCEKPEQVSYHSLAHGCDRHSAAGLFLELLQLKTWDFVELDQDKSFGAIKISPGVKFSEDPPINSKAAASNSA